MLCIRLFKIFQSLKISSDKIVIWMTAALSILALLISGICFLVKTLIPVLPESIEIGEADAPRNRNKKDYTLLKALLEREQPITWLFAGDSITHGCMHTDYLRNYQEHFSQAMKASPERTYDTVVNTGVSGATTRELMRYFNAWVSAYRADVVFICFGMNDCATDGLTPEIYAQNLREAVRRIRASGAVPVLQTPNTSGRQRKLVPYLEKMRLLAAQEGVLLADHNAFWASHPKEVKKLMADSIHPNAYGHLLWIRYLMQSLDLHVSAGGILASGGYHALPLQEDADPVRVQTTSDEVKSSQFASYFTLDKPSVWVYLGGGATAGTRLLQNGARAYPEHIQEVARWEMIGDEYTDRMRFIVNQAHSGDTVADMLQHYDTWAGRFRPIIVSIMPEIERGMEQTPEAFERDLQALIEKAKTGGAWVLLQTPLTLREELEGCLAVMRRMGGQEGVLLLDHARLARETVQASPQAREKWFDAAGEPNAEGALVIARHFCVALLDVPENSRILTKHYSCV